MIRLGRGGENRPDADIVDRGVRHRAGGPRRLAYTEFYAGLTVRGVSARAYYARDYISRRRETLYVEADGGARLAPKLSLAIHLGALTDLGTPPPFTARTRFDWRATVSRLLGPFELYAGLSGRGPGADVYAPTKGRAVATIGAAFVF